MTEPFALTLYRRHLAGESLPQLARKLRIPLARVEMRVRAARAHLKAHETAGDSLHARA